MLPATDNDTRLHRATRVFLARLLMVYGTEAGDVLRRMADDLDYLANEERDDYRQFNLDPVRPQSG